MVTQTWSLVYDLVVVFKLLCLFLSYDISCDTLFCYFRETLSYDVILCMDMDAKIRKNIFKII